MKDFFYWLDDILPQEQKEIIAGAFMLALIFTIWKYGTRLIRKIFFPLFVKFFGRKFAEEYKGNIHWIVAISFLMIIVIISIPIRMSEASKIRKEKVERRKKYENYYPKDSLIFNSLRISTMAHNGSIYKINGQLYIEKNLVRSIEDYFAMYNYKDDRRFDNIKSRDQIIYINKNLDNFKTFVDENKNKEYFFNSSYYGKTMVKEAILFQRDSISMTIEEILVKEIIPVPESKKIIIF